jgi:FkbM family methyltransferase
MMLKAFGLDWRISLSQECWFYYRTCANWRSVIRGRLRSAPFDRFEMRTGPVIAFDGDPPWRIFEDIWRYQIYDRKYPKSWHAPRSVVDVGANVGFFSLYAAARWPTARIFAYEPAPENVKWLERNIATSRANQVRIYPLAVAGSVGRATFYLKQESGWHSLWDNGAQSAIETETTTLEAIVARTGSEPIDLLKIDAEGAEYQILRGREQLLARSVRYIVMEYHELHEHQFQELRDILERSGFDCEIFPEPRWKTGMLYAKKPGLC